MKKQIELKNKVIEDIANKFQKAHSFALLDYQGINVKDITLLRQSLREQNSELKVYKNTLLKRALNDQKLSEFDQDLKGPNAILFDYDEGISGFKAVSKFCKTHQKLSFVAALYNEQRLSKQEVTTLANVPDKQTLMGMLLMSFKMPVIKLACTLKMIKK